MGLDETRAPAHHERFEMVQYMPDPYERFNRGSLAVTKFAVDWVVMPIARGWRFVAPEPLRQLLDNFAHNIAFPVRLVSLWLQGAVGDSASETGRFLINTTIGLAGLFDPATDFAIPAYQEDIGTAFASWGFGPGFYVVLPVLGPSSARDGMGLPFETLLTPTTYVPGAGLALTMNSASFRIDEYEMLAESEADLYLALRGLWSVQRQIEVERFEISPDAFSRGDPEPSLGVLAITLHDPTFPSRMREPTVTTAATGGTLPYSLWLQDDPAPIIYLLPGIGAHRNSTIPVALAERAFQRGYSVATISSPFHPEFLSNALSASYPGYTPSDAKDLYGALAAVHRDLEDRHPGRVTQAHLLGYSLGGIQAIFIAGGEEARSPDALRFERYVAINPPVDLRHAAESFDRYFDAPLAWPAEERDRRVQEVAMKAFLVAMEGLPEGTPLPFDRTESEFLVGFAGRVSMTTTLAALERRGVPTLEIHATDGGGVLADEVNQGSLRRYADELVLPYFLEQTGQDGDPAAIVHAAGLRAQEHTVRVNARVRIVTNADDFILDAGGLAWLRETAGERLHVFPTGGHLGNLNVPEVQAKIFDAFTD